MSGEFLCVVQAIARDNGNAERERARLDELVGETLELRTVARDLEAQVEQPQAGFGHGPHRS